MSKLERYGITKKDIRAHLKTRMYLVFNCDLDKLTKKVKKSKCYKKYLRLAYGAVYRGFMRSIAKKARKLWLNDELIRDELTNLGFEITREDIVDDFQIVVPEQMKMDIFEYYINTVVAPRLKEKFNLENIKATKSKKMNPECLALDFSDVKFADE